MGVKEIKHNFNTDQEGFLNALLKGNRLNAAKIAHSYAGSHEEIKTLYERVIKPALYKVGELWEYNLITVAAEHLATSISESVMNELYENIISEERVERKVVLGCVENELHQVGIKMVADIFEMHGWDTYFLGNGIPTREFIEYAQQEKPNLISLSLTVYSHMNHLQKMVKEIHDEMPGIRILIGGQAFRHGIPASISQLQYVTVLSDLSEIEQYILKYPDYEQK
ncbi:MAG: cobalamin-dependent protein [Prolixibacteraceae bacterium]|nr:cobalamin-dependent protein [Prolixibacteraceae bacterium]